MPFSAAGGALYGQAGDAWAGLLIRSFTVPVLMSGLFREPLLRPDASLILGWSVDKRAIYSGELPVTTAKNKLPDTELSRPVWMAGLVVRTLFIGILIVITARVSSPQLEHIRSLYETPSDVIRVILGFVVCTWLAVNLFLLPKDIGGYRTWLHLGAFLLPLSVLCAWAIW